MSAPPNSDTLPFELQDHLRRLRQDQIPTTVWRTPSLAHTETSRRHLTHGERLWQEQCDREEAEMERRRRVKVEAASGGPARYDEQQGSPADVLGSHATRQPANTFSYDKEVPALPLKTLGTAAKRSGGTLFSWCKRKPEASSSKRQGHENFMPQYTFASGPQGRMTAHKDSTTLRWCFWRRG